MVAGRVASELAEGASCGVAGRALLMPDFVDIVNEVRPLSLTRAARPVEEVERGEDLAARKVIYERLHPEAKHGGDRKSADAIKRKSFPVDRGFATDTAAKTGLSDRTIRHEVQIGSMPEAVREGDAGALRFGLRNRCGIT